MSREIKRQAVKAILKELSDNAIPYQQLFVRAMQEDWDEDKLNEEVVKLLTPESMTKNFDYYTDRIMGVFED